MSLTLRHAPRISRDKFAAILKAGTQAGVSPVAPIANECYAVITAAGLDPAIVLAIWAKETQYGVTGISPQTHNIGNVRTAFHPDWAIGQHPKGFAIFPDWFTGIRDMVDRLDKRYIDEWGLTTVDQIITKYAPPSENDTAGYITFVNNHVVKWVKEDTGPMAGDGWCPWIDDRQPSPNFTEGRGGLAVKACCIHIAEGGFQGSIDWMKKVGTSSHFIIGKNGDIAQLVSINDTAYGNGLSYINGKWIDPDGHVVTPPWPGLTPGINPNKTTISVEHQGFTGEPWTAAMADTDGRLLQWIREQTKLAWVPRQTLIGHYEISPISRANCPGTGVKWDDLAIRGNTSMTVDWVKEWGTVAPYNSGWGVPTAWRATYAAGKPLGAALSVELYNDSDLVMQEFKAGWVSYRRSTGQTQVLR